MTGTLQKTDEPTIMRILPLICCLVLAISPLAQAQSTVKPVASDAQNSLWDSVEQGNTIADYDVYLKEYPRGVYAPLARSRKVALEEKARKAALEEQTLWQIAERSGKKEDVDSYLRRYPSGRFVAKAREKLATVDRSMAEQQPGAVFRDCPDCPEMVAVAGGRLEMGANDGEPAEKPVHRVTVANFSIGRTEVTQAQWRAIMGNNPSFFSNCDDCPVELVDWDEVQEFIKKLNARTGRQYRLPSEAEWEYACKAGTTSTYCGGNAIELVGWYSANSGSIYFKKSRPVMKKQANVFGLHDMSGNVAEWVQDCWNESYKNAPDDGSAWSDGNCTQRVIRGGSWINSERYARATDRYGVSADDRNRFIGFRLALPGRK